MITLKIDVTKIDKAHLFVGTKGKYLDVVLRENKDGPDKYGNDGFVVQGVSKEARAAGTKGPIIGNWKRMQRAAGAATPKPASPGAKPEQDDAPF